MAKIHIANMEVMRGFVCTACGETSNADTNAARNILARAFSGEEYRRWNTPLLDVEASTLVACETPTHLTPPRLDAVAV